MTPYTKSVSKARKKTPRILKQRRVGRPRDNWLEKTLKEAYERIVPENLPPLNIENEHEMKWIIDAAKNRDDIFETKPKPDKPNPFATPNLEIN